MRRISEPKREKVTGSWRNYVTEKLRKLYSSPHVIRLAKSKGMRCVGHLTRTGQTRSAYKLSVGDPE